MASPILAKPTGIVAASPGRGDAAGSRSHLANTAAGAGATVSDETFGIASIYGHLTDGAVSDDELLIGLRQWVEGFVTFVGQRVDV